VAFSPLDAALRGLRGALPPARRSRSWRSHRTRVQGILSLPPEYGIRFEKHWKIAHSLALFDFLRATQSPQREVRSRAIFWLAE